MTGWLLRRFFRLWVRTAVQPSEPPPALASQKVPVCYVLERDSRADLAVLCNLTERLHLPRSGRAACLSRSGALTSTSAGAGISGTPRICAVRRRTCWR